MNEIPLGETTTSGHSVNDGGEKANRKFNFLSPADIESLPDLLWLVSGILPKPCLAVLYGEPGSFKSFVALDLGLAVARGGAWLDRETIPAKVLYIVAEGVLGFKLRLAAQKIRHGSDPKNVLFLAFAIDLADVSEVEALLKQLKQDEFIPDCIIVDTLARVTVGADENNARDMGKAVAALDRLKNATMAAMLVIHHTRKGGDSERGSSALRGAADVMILCERTETLDGLAVKLTCSKMKDDEPFKPITAKLERIEMAGGKSSLVLGHPVDGGLNVAGFNADRVVHLLGAQFATTGATNGELYAAFTQAGYGSKSTFDRAFRSLKHSDRVEVVKGNGKSLIFPTRP